MTPQPESSLRRQLLLGIFVVSGFTGLIYESIWSHYLKLFLGHAAYAQTLVLTIFMGGMAIGSWLVARYSGRIRRLLWGYVLVEGVIGLLGLVFHRGFVAITDVSFASVIPALAAPFAIHTYKWSLAALLILPQSIAVARRDAAAIVPSATPLLEQPDSTLLTDREYLVIALASAQLRLGDVERARAALASVPADSEQQAYRLPLRQLRALAESASGAAQAASNATSADARQ